MQPKWSRVLLLAGAILAFTAAVSAIGFWKYAHYRYGGMDLAIYTNVLWSLSHGGGWFSSIQGSSYLGDHVEPVLLLIAPLFRIWSDSRLLLILQAFALGLTAIPVFLILRSNIRERWAVVLTMLWLLNPLLWNAALFEFHALAFAPLFLLSAAYAYVRRRFWWFLFWLLLSLSVREDIALVAVTFGVVALVDWWRQQRRSGASAGSGGPSARREIAVPGGMPSGQDAVEPEWAWFAAESRESEGGTRASPPRWGGRAFLNRRRPTTAWRSTAIWIITPLLLGLAWFAIATRIAAVHSPSGAYKFLVYYGWLVPRSLGEVGLRAVWEYTAPFLRHIVSIGNLDMIVGLLLPFLFLPAIPLVEWFVRGSRSADHPTQRGDQKNTIVENWSIRGAWLLLALPPLLQILLAEPGGSNVVVELHYGLLFLPALALASIEVIKKIVSPPLSEGERLPAEALAKAGEGVRLWGWLARRFPLPKPFAISLGLATYLAAAWTLGPFPGIATAAIRGASADERTRAVAYDELLQIVQSRTSDTSGISIAAGYAALPHIAARSGAYALPYAYLGVNQYAFAPYVLPNDVQYVMLDQRDALAYAVQFPSVRWSAPYAAEGPQRLRSLIAQGSFGLVAERDGIALLERGAATAVSDAIDQRYFEPSKPPRGRLGIDDLRDIVVQLDR